MNKLKPYKEETTDKQVVSEPIAEYASTVTVNAFVDAVPQDALAQAARFAVKEHRIGKCIPHASLDFLVKERMGWK